MTEDHKKAAFLVNAEDDGWAVFSSMILFGTIHPFKRAHKNMRRSLPNNMAKQLDEQLRRKETTQHFVLVCRMMIFAIDIVLKAQHCHE